MPADLAPADRAALENIVGQLEAAWNAMDGAAFGAPFAADADFVNFRGEHARGQAAIIAGHAAIFRTIYAGSTNQLTVEGARLLRPEVALVRVHSRLDGRLPSAQRAWFLVAVGLLLTGQPLAAQQPTFRDSLLDRFVGSWLLRGTIAGRPTTHDVDVPGRPAYEADVYIGWDPQTGQYVCVWLDTYGGISTQSLGRATPGGETIPLVFTERDSPGRFYTAFAYHRSSDGWTWQMDAQQDTVTTPFARVTLTPK